MHVQALAQMIGIPFKDKGRDLTGFDCWGAVQFGLANGFNVTVPSYAEEYLSAQERREIAALIGRESLAWMEMPLRQARSGDVLILRIAGQPWHCGLILTPPTFLHADRHAGVVIERWDSVLWKDRVLGVYRHVEPTVQAIQRNGQ